MSIIQLQELINKKDNPAYEINDEDMGGQSMKKIMTAMSIFVVICLMTGCSTGDHSNNRDSSNNSSISGAEPLELTKDVNTIVCIDYSIDSFEPVQQFSYELFLQNIEDTNPVLSPVSAYLAMGMAGLGAKGETLLEFQNVLNGDMLCIPDYMMKNFPKEEAGMQISIANSAWISEGLEVKDSWLNYLSSQYEASVWKGDLSSGACMDSINSWICEQTRELIPAFLEEPLSPDARLALFNTIYFKGNWKDPFEAGSTREKEFMTSNGKTVPVDMMQKYHCNLDYVHTETMEGVVLPYESSSLSFVALKPTAGQSVREMYREITFEELELLLQNKESTLVNLQLPKFNITFDKQLNDSFIQMGLGQAFDVNKADFSGIGTMPEGENLYISLVRQKAVICVDEEGTEAAAVTEVAMERAAAELAEEPLNVFFCEPFLYMIMDTKTNVPLFMGIMDDPSVKK